MACKKGEPLNPMTSPPLAKLQVQGLVLVDTIQFVLNGDVIGEAIDGSFTLKDGLYTAGDQVVVRRKDNKITVGEIVVAETPYLQIKKIFYDGTTYTDKLAVTPVSDPANMGFRLQFSTPFKDYTGGPVDVEIFDYYIDYDVFEFIYTPVKTVSNVTAVFGEFFEMPPLLPDHFYAFRVFKAGTKEFPFTSLENVSEEFLGSYGSLGNLGFVPGDSQLLDISPYLSDNNGVQVIGSGYEVIDISQPFK